MCTFALFVILSYKYSIWIFYYLSYALVLRFTILFRSLAITNYDVHPCDDHTRTCCSIRVTMLQKKSLSYSVSCVLVLEFTFPCQKGSRFPRRLSWERTHCLLQRCTPRSWDGRPVEELCILRWPCLERRLLRSRRSKGAFLGLPRRICIRTGR